MWVAVNKRLLSSSSLSRISMAITSIHITPGELYHRALPSSPCLSDTSLDLTIKMRQPITSVQLWALHL